MTKDKPIDKSKLKGLETQISKLKSEVDLDKLQLSTIQKSIKSKVERIKELERKLNKLKGSSKLIVSEHAILRYLERIKGLDTNEVIESILNEDLLEVYTKLGTSSGKFPCNDFKVVIKNNVIVTIED